MLITSQGFVNYEKYGPIQQFVGPLLFVIWTVGSHGQEMIVTYEHLRKITDYKIINVTIN